ncbi:MAG: hypothetical protein OHK0056_18230 [Bacteriovoracaceae bacterium]
MKNVVLCASLNEESIDLLKTLKGSPLLNGNKIHLVHCFEIQVYTSDFSPFIYPTEDKYHEIESACLKILDNLASEICTADQMKNVEKHVYFTQSPKQKIRDYLKEKKADLVVVATRGKHGIEGLFSSSFAEHLVKYAPCDVHILRPVHK